MRGLRDDQDEQRRLIAEHHANDFSLAELDAEVGYKKLVTVLGGGGGAGFVYIGAMAAPAGERPGAHEHYGSSFGSIIGAVVGRALPVPIEEYVAWAKTVSYRAILGSERMRRRHGLTGMFTLRFDEFADAMFRREDGERMRMSDMAIPYDAVVAGVRRQSFVLRCLRGFAVNSSRRCGSSLDIPHGIGRRSRLHVEGGGVRPPVPRRRAGIVIGATISDAADFNGFSCCSVCAPARLHHEELLADGPHP